MRVRLRIAELSLWRWLPRRRLDGWTSIDAIGLQDYTCPKSAWTSKTHQTYLKSTRWCKICGLCICGIAACVAFIKNISVHGCIILKQKNPFLASLLVTFLGWRKRDPNSKVDSWKLVTSIAWLKLPQMKVVLLMDKIPNNHLGCLKPYQKMG